MKMKQCLQEIIQLLKGIHENTQNTRINHEQQAPVRKIIKEVEVIKEVPVEVIKEVTVEKEVIKEVPDLFSRELAATGIGHFQTAFSQDDELLKQFPSVADESKAQQLIRLIAVMSQWNNIEELWDILSARCKKEQRAATEQELFLLQQSIAIHNFSYQNRAATLNWPEVGKKYDFNTQTQGNLKGDTVAAVWLPGLKSAGGEVRKKPLVETN